jgi:hypothetical protein
MKYLTTKEKALAILGLSTEVGLIVFAILTYMI